MRPYAAEIELFADVEAITVTKYHHADGSSMADEIVEAVVAAGWRPPRPHRVTKDGNVMVGSTRLGHVDRYDPSVESRVGTTWRAVKDGGRTAGHRFATRDEAAEWVVAP